MRRTIGVVMAVGLCLMAAEAWADGPVVNQSTCSGKWNAPQTNADGTNLIDLKEYGVYVAATPAALAALTAPVAVVVAPELNPPAGKTAVWPCAQLATGQWYAQVDAVDTSGNRSTRSGVSPFVSRDDVSPQAPDIPTFGP